MAKQYPMWLGSPSKVEVWLTAEHGLDRWGVFRSWDEALASLPRGFADLCWSVRHAFPDMVMLILR